jgi:hypothetical protein
MDTEERRHGGMDMNGPRQSSDPPAFHGMLVFGGESAYLSHLPMFMAPPHRYQLIMGAALENGGADQLPAIVADRKKTGTRMYSFAPTHNFALTDLVTPDPNHPRLDSFPGTVVRGHFEAGHFEPLGEPLIADVMAHIEHVFVFDKFAHQAKELPSLQYFLFGRSQERFLAHVLTRPPDFDQVIAVRLPNQQLTDEELGHALLVSFTGRTNSRDQRLTEGEQLEGTIQLSGQHDRSFDVVELQVGQEFYFEVNDLAN